jgi:hypothetical protein
MNEIPIQAKVVCSEGPCGEQVGVVIERASRTVIFYVVKGSDIPDPDPRLVESDLAVSASAQELTLRCSKDKLLVMTPFLEQNFSVADLPENRTAWNYGFSGAVSGGETAMRKSYQTEGGGENIGKDEVYLRPAMVVHAADGSIGKLSHLLADDSGAITDMVLQEGHWWGRKLVTLPLEAVNYVDDNNVHVRLDRHAIGGQPDSAA